MSATKPPRKDKLQLVTKDLQPTFTEYQALLFDRELFHRQGSPEIVIVDHDITERDTRQRLYEIG